MAISHLSKKNAELPLDRRMMVCCDDRRLPSTDIALAPIAEFVASNVVGIEMQPFPPWRGG